MIQDIAPRKFDITFKLDIPKDTDYAVYFIKDKILLYKEAELAEFRIPKVAEIEEFVSATKENAIYLFSVDEDKFFLICENERDASIDKESGNLEWKDIGTFRALQPEWMAFAGITASQLYRWMCNHKFCGKCGKPLVASKTERAFFCESCQITQYPKISPAVIVGIVNGERILMTKYANREYTRYALIAGFGEVGESLEDTVRREVMEEVGLKVKEITYYKSQPWSFSDSLLVGFFAKLDGDSIVTLDDGELAEATWMERHEIPDNPSKISLTAEMMQIFKDNKEIFK